jgi:hypothetical protein
MNKKIKCLFMLSLLISLPLVVGYAKKAQQNLLLTPELNATLEGICVDDLYAHILYLASDELQGRPTPSIYCDIAGRYIEDEFWEYNLKPRGGNGTFQQFYTINIYPDNSENLKISYSFGDFEWKLNADEVYPFLRALAGTSINAEGEIAFVGYGITAPERGWDDYENLDVRGKIVLIMDGAPWQVNNDDEIAYDKSWGKIVNAAQRGAVGFIYGAYLPQNQQRQTAAFLKILSNGYLLQRNSLHPQIHLYIPGIFIPVSAAQQIVNAVNNGNVSSLLNVSNEDRRSLDVISSGLKFSLTLDAEPQQAQTFNVVGLLKGSDPLLANEYIALTAHYDHIGVGTAVNGDSIYNGADDNASGTAGVLELAEAFSSLPKTLRPRRSILFILLSGEERGLFGSSHFAENPTVPINRIKADINLDMIGRYTGKGLEVIAPGSDWLSSTMILNARNYGLKALPDQHPESRLLYRSDCFPFTYCNIPAALCFTGIHDDYHQPSDEIDKINFIDMEKIVRAVFLTAIEVANRDKIPAFKPPAYFFRP